MLFNLINFIHFSLKPLDIECMKALHSLVNVVPIIAKADTSTEAEIKKQKTRVS